MIGLEYLLYAGEVALLIYVFVSLYFLMQLWRSVPPHNLRAVLVKVIAALCWPYVVWQVSKEALE